MVRFRYARIAAGSCFGNAGFVVDLTEAREPFVKQSIHVVARLTSGYFGQKAQKFSIPIGGAQQNSRVVIICVSPRLAEFGEDRCLLGSGILAVDRRLVDRPSRFRLRRIRRTPRQRDAKHDGEEKCNFSKMKHDGTPPQTIKIFSNCICIVALL